MTTRSSRETRRAGTHTTRIAGIVLALALALSRVQAHAGCGCEKPPPAPAQVRPQVTYSTMPVTLFSAQLVVGASYDVTFTSMSGAAATVRGQAAARRDLADAVIKPQLSVMLPTLPLGPAAISVRAVGASAPLLAISDQNFTVAPDPIALPTAYGTWTYPERQAAVGRDGVVYLSLDLTGMTEPLIFEADLLGYALRFTEQDVVFMNAQGFLMQLLVQDEEPIPGMFVFPASSPSTTSDQLHYSRHEFNTYYLQHFERQPHALDPNDPSWHLDGTRHIDHDHLIIGVIGHKNDGTLPAAGATPTFDVRLNAYSLFHQGLVGASSISMSNSSSTEGFDPATGQTDAHGDVFTNGQLSMSGTSMIRGDATAASFSACSSATITGSTTQLQTPTTFMTVKVPTGIPDVGDINVYGGATRTIVGPGSFKARKLSLSNNSHLFIDNSAGPVTLYVTADAVISGGSDLTVADPNPEKFAIYMVGSGRVSLSGNGTTFYGVVYGPSSAVTISGQGVFAGSFIGDKVNLSGTTRVRYDSALRGR